MVNVMVNGLPGRMATAVAESILGGKSETSDLCLLGHSLAGPEDKPAMLKLGVLIELIRPDRWDERIKEVQTASNRFISVDYTVPGAVNNNADFYCERNLPFVMGTTGGDRTALEQRVRDSNTVAVIAPNMAKQIVAFQAMMKYAAETFPNAFKGYSLEIIESHQKGKKDTSGTAKAMVDYFNKLGIPFRPEQILMIRDPDEQRATGIPKEHLGGHGWHTYTLKSADGSVLFEFVHNVNGRKVYAEGTLDAVRFLHKKVEAGEKGKVYSMIDVLKGE
jgi:4-hydroxy-tetrahydrodipicolinate reductase